MKRSATAVWNGQIKEGKGTMSSKSNAFKNLPYSYHSRFEEGPGTNPEELIAAAHAGCFSMALSAQLGQAGLTPESIETTATITLAEGVISQSHLQVKAKVPGATKEAALKCANDAKANCPVSKVLKLDISMEFELL